MMQVVAWIIEVYLHVCTFFNFETVEAPCLLSHFCLYRILYYWRGVLVVSGQMSCCCGGRSAFPVQKLCQEQQKRLWLLGGGEEGEGRRRNRNANFSLGFLPLDLLQGHILFSSFLSSTCPKQKEAGRQQHLMVRGCSGACLTWSTLAVKPTRALTGCSETVRNESSNLFASVRAAV